MVIKTLSLIPRFEIFLSPNKNGRQVDIHLLENATICSKSVFYPNILLSTKDDLFNPMNERVGSLEKVADPPQEVEHTWIWSREFLEPVFYFIYNVDNYYHFIYDTLPYLISFKSLKNRGLVQKILINTSQVGKFYPFVSEFLQLCGISLDDMIIAEKDVLYKKIFISSSYTHGHNSDLAPRLEIYPFFRELTNIDCSGHLDKEFLPEKIYISRRSHLHGDTSNIGTDYTSRRKLLLEDELVHYLEGLGFTEIFTEKLTTHEKICLFKNAKVVVGCIGGGTCNVLFSNPSTKLISLCSPYFLDYNKRFLWSFSGVNISLFTETFNTESGTWKKWMRVQSGDVIGEIQEVKEETLVLNVANEKVAGWNNQLDVFRVEISKYEAKPLDEGINSEWSFDMDVFKKFFEKAYSNQ